MTTPASERDPLERLAEEFAERYRRGERPALSEYTQKYPELAEQIRDLFPALAVIEELGSTPGRESGRAGHPRTGNGSIPERLGDYRLLREVGRGGMGLVFEAVQESLGRHVALKVLPFQSLASPTQLERFRREARAAARLHHTNIVPVFGVGEHDGICYYAMQFIQGQGLDMVLHELKRLHRCGNAAAETGQPAGPGSAASIACRLRTGHFASAQAPPGQAELPAEPAPAAVEPCPEISANRFQCGSLNGSMYSPPSHSELTGPFELPYFRSVARVGLQVAEALEYAHRQGILHRDIKPSNLLLDNAGTVWVTDFGLAKTEGADELTNTGEVVGTLRYMAPERFAGRCDPRSEVYSLGITLYELLTLAPAFSDSNRARLIARVSREEPTAPRKLDIRIPRDLETVVLKAMAKEPGARYATAAALAEDLQRFLADRSILARRAGPGERVWRWGKRNPALAAASGLAAVGLVAALAVSVSFGIYQYQAAARIDKALAESQRHLAELALDKGLTLCEQEEVGRGMLWLAHSLQIAPADATDLKRVIRTNLAGWRSLSGTLRSAFPAADGFEPIAFSPDGKTVLMGGKGKIQFWNRASGQPVGPAYAGEKRTWAFAPNSRTALTVCPDNRARLWETATGKPVAEPLVHQGPVLAAAFSPDGQTVLTGSQDKTARFWDAATGKLGGAALTHRASVRAVAFSPNGRTVATASKDGTARIWDTANRQPVGQPLAHQGACNVVAFSPDGRMLATGSQDGIVRFWDVGTGQPRGQPLAQEGPLNAVSFSPDGRTILTRTDHGKAQLYETATAKLIGPLFHRAWVNSAAYNSDGAMVVTGSTDGTVRLWQAASAKPIGAPLQQPDSIRAVAFSSDGRTVLVGCRAGVRVWDVSGGNLARQILRHPSGLSAVAFSPDGRRVLTGGASVQLWDAVTGKSLDPPFPHQWSPAVAFSPDGKVVLTGSEADQSARLWDAATGRPIGLPLRHSDGVCAVAFSPDGRTILTGSTDRSGRLWDVATGQTIGQPLQHESWVDAVAFSPDGKVAATTGEDGTVRFWDPTTGNPLGSPLQYRTSLKALVVSPDGKTVVTGGIDGIIQQWDVATRRPVGPGFHHAGEVRGVAFSPDGRTILAGSRDHTARLWDAATGYAVGPPFRHENEVRAVAFAPNGQAVATASYDATARLWSLPQALEGEPERITLWVQVITGMELERGGTASVLDNATWNQRRERLHELGGPPVP